MGKQFAELVINIEARLDNTFHYRVPRDLQNVLRIGHLVEVEFGRRLAQGIVVGFDDQAPVDEVKPIISLVASEPVVWGWQIDLARWMSQQYLTPLNGCLRLMLPPGLTRWADVTVDINPRWDGNGRLTDLQQRIIDHLKEKGDARGRQLKRVFKKEKWETAINQLVKRDVLRKASVLDPPRLKPKRIRTAELIAGEKQMNAKLPTLGRASKAGDILLYLWRSADPLPPLDEVLEATNANEGHLQQLLDDGLVTVQPATILVIGTGKGLPEELAELLPLSLREFEENLTAESAEGAEKKIEALQKAGHIHLVRQPWTVSLAIAPEKVLPAVMAYRKGEKYLAILRLLAREAQAVNLTDIYAELDVSIGYLRKLVKLDLIRFGSEEVWRDPLADRDFMPAEPPPLTKDQSWVWGRVRVSMMNMEDGRNIAIPAQSEAAPWEVEEPALPSAPLANEDELLIKPFLLHGVTGSGKTEIYMRAISYALTLGRTAVVLVPEIALTPQTVRRFSARFPGRVAVLHSRLTDGERYDTWRRARAGLFDIIVGPRSALFAPLPNVGVIIMDEEHDPSYKQTPPVPPPYYHTRDVAIALCRQLGATLIMGSATPDVVTYHRAQGGRYQLLELQKRVMGHRQRIESQARRLQLISHYQQQTDDPDDALTIPLPPIQVVDLRQELRAGNRSIFSRALERAITETLDRGEQIILFLNRRGSSTFVLCRDCGHIMKSPRTDIPLTLHRGQRMLVDHQSGYREPIPEICPICGSKRIRYFGLGTEGVEEQVRQRWPEARVTRWDRDTTAGRNTHQNLLASFINQEADILIGTQMIAKGLDLPFVTLVGVISADVSLALPDYRTGERAFQVLAQVAGRAGRGLLGGRVIIQTYKPEHYAIQAAAEHDFASFYIDEIKFRTQHGLPPFRRLAKLVYVDPINDRGQREAEKLAKGLRVHIRNLRLTNTEILGPVPPFFNRLDGRYRWQIILRTPSPNRVLDAFPVPPNWMVDIDPVSTL